MPPHATCPHCQAVYVGWGLNAGDDRCDHCGAALSTTATGLPPEPADTTPPALKEKVARVNELLTGYGVEALQEVNRGYKVFYGYKPQYVFDAVNEVLDAGWRFELHEHRFMAEERAVYVLGTVSLRSNGCWVTHGPQAGQGSVTQGGYGDALKSGITDAIQKGFSLFSIGSNAFRGKLGEVFNRKPPSPTEGKQKAPPSAGPPRPDHPDPEDDEDLSRRLGELVRRSIRQGVFKDIETFKSHIAKRYRNKTPRELTTEERRDLLRQLETRVTPA